MPSRYDPAKHHRRSIRLRGYDYSQGGAYFVTACTQGRGCFFGQIARDVMRLNRVGRMIRTVWDGLPERFPTVELDAFVAMPNHVHGIIIVGAPLVGAQNNRAGTRPAPTIGHIMGAFKSVTTGEYVTGVRHHGWHPFQGRLWQRNYYEHIIRDEDELNLIRAYVTCNPLGWALDRENPDAPGAGTRRAVPEHEPWRV